MIQRVKVEHPYDYSNIFKEKAEKKEKEELVNLSINANKELMKEFIQAHDASTQKMIENNQVLLDKLLNHDKRVRIMAALYGAGGSLVCLCLKELIQYLLK